MTWTADEGHSNPRIQRIPIHTMKFDRVRSSSENSLIDDDRKGMYMNAIIFHGSTPSSSPEKGWYPVLAETLRNHNIEATIVDLPRLSRQSLSESLQELSDLNLHCDENTILIGHSAGTNVILSFLQRSNIHIYSVFLVAGFCSPILTNEPTLEAAYDWDTISSRAERFTMLNSYNDPYHCDYRQGKQLFDHLGGTLIMTNNGHYSDADQPLLTRLVLAEIMQ